MCYIPQPQPHVHKHKQMLPHNSRTPHADKYRSMLVEPTSPLIGFMHGVFVLVRLWCKYRYKCMYTHNTHGMAYNAYPCVDMRNSWAQKMYLDAGKSAKGGGASGVEVFVTQMAYMCLRIQTCPINRFGYSRHRAYAYICTCTTKHYRWWQISKSFIFSLYDRITYTFSRPNVYSLIPQPSSAIPCEYCQWNYTLFMPELYCIKSVNHWCIKWSSKCCINCLGIENLTLNYNKYWYRNRL